MTEKLEEKENTEPEEKEDDCQSPPKKLHIVSKPRKGKENKTPVRNKRKKPSNILVVGAKMNKEPLKEVTFNIHPSIPEL